jgi:A/G-specific adenine glycosylase
VLYKIAAAKVMKFGETIRSWYQKYQRELPWRQTTDPYRIWLSEVIMQQTRVDQGLRYYLDFLEAFPHVHALAAATEQQVLKHWQGLGYYSRARNLHHTARLISGGGGSFPDSYTGLLALKGVGPYTAAAVASICYGEPRAVVDGNVARVLARLYAVEETVNEGRGKRLVEGLAAAEMEAAVQDGAEPGVHNQALMEFGALQCVPRDPSCPACPLAQGCAGRLQGIERTLPRKKAKQSPTERYFYYYVLRCGNEFILQRRDGDDIWKGLYQFPLAETPEALEDQVVVLDQLPRKNSMGQLRPGNPSPVFRHQLSHRTLLARFLPLEVEHWPRPLPPGWLPIKREDLPRYPVPRLLERYMDSAKIFYL